jgi:small-conductance mechanosensitive channel
MGAFAFFLLMVTALGGTMVFIEWYDGERQAAPNGTLAVVVSHVALAVATLVLLALFLATRGATLASVMLGLLLLTAAFGITAFLRSRRGQPTRRREGDVGRGFLVFHGGAAAVLILVAVVAALSAH